MPLTVLNLGQFNPLEKAESQSLNAQHRFVNRSEGIPGFWFVDEDPFHTEKVAANIIQNNSADKLITINGSKLQEYQGNVKLKSLDCSHNIKAAVYACFHYESDINSESLELQKALCILHEGGLVVIADDGKSIELPLPYAIRNIFPSPIGLMLEADHSDEFLNKSSLDMEENSENSSMLIDEQEVAPPQFFSLIHPLQEIRPVSVYRDREDTNRSTKFPYATPDEWLCNPNLTILLAQADAPFVILYDKLTKKHSCWVLKTVVGDPTRVKDYNRAKKLNEALTIYFEEFGKEISATNAKGKVASTPVPGSAQAESLQTNSYITLLNEELCMRADLFLQLVFEEPNTSDAASSVYIAHDRAGETLICLQGANRLVTWTIKFNLHFEVKVSESFIIENCISSAPIVAIPRVSRNIFNSNGLIEAGNKYYDILAVNKKGEVHVFYGSLESCIKVHFSSKQYILLPHNNNGESVSSKNGAEDVAKTLEAEDVIFLTPTRPSLADKIEDFVVSKVSDAVGRRCNCHFMSKSGKTLITRVCFPVRPISLDILRFFRGLDHVIPSILLDRLLFACIECHFSEESQLQENDEWNALKYCISGTGGSSTENGSSTKTDWQFLLQSNYQNKRLFHPGFAVLLQNSNSSSSDGYLQQDNSTKDTLTKLRDDLTPYRKEMLRSLHFAMEDMTLSTIRWCHLKPAISLLYSFAEICEEAEFQEYYRVHYPSFLNSEQESSRELSTAKSYTSVPSIYQDLISVARNILSGDDLISRWKESKFPLTQCVVTIFAIVFGSQSVDSPSAVTSKQESSYTLPVPGVSYPTVLLRRKETSELKFANIADKVVMTIIRYGISKEVIDHIPFGIASLIRAALASCRLSPKIDWPADAYRIIDRDDLAEQADILSPEDSSDGTLNPCFAGTFDNSVPLFKAHTLPSQVTGTEIHDPVCSMRFTEDLRLYHVQQMLTSSKQTTIKIKSDEIQGRNDHDLVQLYQQKLWLTAQRTMALPVGRGALTLCTDSPFLTEPTPIPKIELSVQIAGQKNTTFLDEALLPPRYNSWAKFHNGVAAGLRIRPGQAHINSTWIVYNRTNREPTDEHGGFILAMGLLGHLAVLNLTKVFEYLSESHEMTSTGMLLGLSATNLGSMHEHIAKILSIHIPALHPPASTDLEVPAKVQCAAIVGLGLLYCQSSHRRMTEIMIDEIGILPTDDKDFSRESYSLSAGIALGLISLGKGDRSPGLSDLHIVDRLIKYICGGTRNGVFTGASQRLGSHDLYKNATVTGLVLEGPNINVDISGPGAVFALTMLFMKTDDYSVAQRVELPRTAYLLDYVRPDMMLLRVMAKNIIMWNSMECSLEWVQGQVVDIIRQGIALYMEIDSQRKVQVEADITLKQESIPDIVFLRQCELNILTGACSALALKHAGTSNKEARDVILKILAQTLEMKGKVLGNEMVCGTLRKLTINNTVLEDCIGVLAVCCSIIMAGSGDLTVLKMLRKLRNRSVADLCYGNHMAISMAIGFLFLGGGRLTFSRSNLGVAMLLCTIYPLFPKTTSDCHYHLQALRHLYVLGVEDRCFVTLDVDNHHPVQLDTVIVLKSGEEVKCRSPFILPELPLIAQVRVQSPSYWDRKMELSVARHLQLIRRGNIFVKRKATSSSITSESLIASSGNDFLRLMINSGAYSASTTSLEEILRSSASATVQFQGGRAQWNTFCANAIADALAKEQPELIELYLNMWFVALSIGQMHANYGTLPISNLVLSECLGSSISQKIQTGTAPIHSINMGFVLQLQDWLQGYFYRQDFDGQSLEEALRLYLQGKTHQLTAKSQIVLFSYIVWQMIPSSSNLAVFTKQLKETFHGKLHIDPLYILPDIMSEFPLLRSHGLHQVAKTLVS